MNLFRQKDTEFYGLANLTEDQLIALFNVCINYKSYIKNLLTLKDPELLAFAPGSDAKQVRANLKMQEKTCDDFISMWQANTNPGQPDKIKN